MCVKRCLFVSMALAAWMGLAGCQAPQPAGPPTKPEPTPPPPPVEPQVVQEVPPTTGELPIDPLRWVYVERIKDGASDPWANGAFDSARNKLSIETHDVRRFAVDVSRIPINWERLVILSINGRNSELRRRDFHVYHFEHDKYGRWAVMEP